MISIALRLRGLQRSRAVARWLLLAALASGGSACQGADDMIVRSSEIAAGTMALRAQQQSSYDLGRLFDQQTFGRLGGLNQVLIVNGRGATQSDASIDLAFKAIRQRCERRIETLEIICGLDAGQIRSLGIALESDLTRVRGQIELERERYVGRTVSTAPEGDARAVLEELRLCATRCRGLFDSVTGPDSLFGGILQDILVPAQAVALDGWVEARRACRWSAMVKMALVQLDEAGLGLSERQASALERCLIARAPRLDVLREENGVFDARAAHFQTVLVTSRLGQQREPWEHLLDPRQRAMLDARIASCGEPSRVEDMLVDQGILERSNDSSRDKETE